MRCLSRAFENPQGMRFWNECGAPLKGRCPQCGLENPPRSKFCGECGASLTTPSPASRPQPPSPATPTPLRYAPRHLDDIVLTTRSALEGERRQVTAEVHRFEGTVNQYTGDGVMALFGAPIAHEDGPCRAVHATLGIQRAMRDYSGELQTLEITYRQGLLPEPAYVFKHPVIQDVAYNSLPGAGAPPATNYSLKIQ